MKKLSGIFVALLIFMLGGCGKEAPKVPEQKVMYTQVNMWYVDKRYKQADTTQAITGTKKQNEGLKANHLIEATNFKRDHLIPINSQVEIVEIDKNAIFFIYDKKMIALKNIKKYTKMRTAELSARTFGEAKVDLSMYSPERRAEIEQGVVTEGMSKATVLLTRGYPPAHKTPDLKADNWRYWNGRSNSRMYHFAEDRYTGYTD